MLLDLKEVFEGAKKRIEINTQFSISEMNLLDVPISSKPILIDGFVENRAGIISLAYSAKVVIHGTCDRCAEEFSRLETLHQEHILVQNVNNEQTADFLVCEDQRLDFFELAVSDIVLWLPSKILCNDDCKGLCPSCGTNLNKNECNCLSSKIDPRLEKLKELL